MQKIYNRNAQYKLAKQNNAQKFLIATALGADATSKIFYSRIKGEVEEAITNIGLPSVSIFQPSLLLGDRAEFRFGEKIAMGLTPLYRLLLVGSLKKYRPIQAKHVAYAMYTVGQMEEKGTNIYPSDQIEELNPQKQESAQYI